MSWYLLTIKVVGWTLCLGDRRVELVEPAALSDRCDVVSVRFDTVWREDQLWVGQAPMLQARKLESSHRGAVCLKIQ